MGTVRHAARWPRIGLCIAMACTWSAQAHAAGPSPATPAAAPATAAAAPRIPLVEGLSVTTAVAERAGDYESRKRLARREGPAWIVQYSASVPGTGAKPEPVSGERRLHDADLATATAYRSAFEGDVFEDYPGSTALGTSRAVLEALRTQGRSAFSLQGDARWLAGAMAAAPRAASDGALPLGSLIEGLMAGAQLSFKGELVRTRRILFPVLANDRAVRVPALVATGTLLNRKRQPLDVQLTFLDDPANPLALEWRIGTSSLRTVRINWPQPDAGSALAKTLVRERRVALPGLYFDFGSATLRPESKAALPAIAEAIRATSGPLRLEGHTDAVGADAANQALSAARARSVRDALIARDASLAKRLQAEGFGETRPVASNATLEGRARNRRVELVLP